MSIGRVMPQSSDWILKTLQSFRRSNVIGDFTTFVFTVVCFQWSLLSLCIYLECRPVEETVRVLFMNPSGGAEDAFDPM